MSRSWGDFHASPVGLSHDPEARLLEGWKDEKQDPKGGGVSRHHQLVTSGASIPSNFKLAPKSQQD